MKRRLPITSQGEVALAASKRPPVTQFIEQDEADGELRVTGDDDAGMLLWAAQWLDEHREYIITAMRFEHPAEPGDEASITATVVISLECPGYDPDPAHTSPRLGPWPHGVPPMPL